MNQLCEWGNNFCVICREKKVKYIIEEYFINNFKPYFTEIDLKAESDLTFTCLVIPQPKTLKPLESIRSLRLTSFWTKYVATNNIKTEFMKFKVNSQEFKTIKLIKKEITEILIIT